MTFILCLMNNEDILLSSAVMLNSNAGSYGIAGSMSRGVFDRSIIISVSFYLSFVVQFVHFKKSFLCGTVNPP